MTNNILKCFLEVLGYGEKCLPYSSGKVVLRALLNLLNLTGCQIRVKPNGISDEEYEYLYELASGIVKKPEIIINDKNLGILHLLLILKDHLDSMFKNGFTEKHTIWKYFIDNSRIQFADNETREASINREILSLLKNINSIGRKERVRYLNLSGVMFLDGIKEPLFLTNKMKQLLTDYFSAKSSEQYLRGKKVWEPINYSDFLKMKEILSSETKLKRSYKKYLIELDLNILRKKILIASLELPFIIPVISMNQLVRNCLMFNSYQFEILSLSTVKIKPEDFSRLVEQLMLIKEIYFLNKFLNIVNNLNKTESFVKAFNKDHFLSLTSQKIFDLLNEPEKIDLWEKFINEHIGICEFSRKYLKIRHITNWVRIWDKAVGKHILPEIFQ